MTSSGASGLAVRPSEAGNDLEILVRQAPSRESLVFELKAEELGINYQEFGPVRLHRSPGEYFTELFRRIDPPRSRGGKTRGAGTSAIVRVESNLRIAGSFLIRELLPADLRDELWRLQSRVERVQIQSDEPWVPWELLRLELRRGGRVDRLGPFFCEAFQVTQWRRGCDVPSRLGNPPSLDVRSIAVVAPRRNGVASAEAELDFLLGLRRLGCRVERIEARPEPVLEAFASGEHDLFHFVGHGEEFLGSDPDSATIFLEDLETLHPFHLAGEAGRLGVRSPLIFLNACHTGKQGLSLTGQGGWASRFLEAGASAFVGSHWAITDRRALEFCKAFYRALIAGDNLARAMHSARFSIRRQGDPTWLAYTAFGHPCLTCRWSEAPLTLPLGRRVVSEPPPLAPAAPPSRKAPSEARRGGRSGTAPDEPVPRATVPEARERMVPASPEPHILLESPKRHEDEAAVALRIHEKTGMELVRVPAGRYVLGSDRDEPESRPEHMVFLSEFWIARGPVTNAEYRRFLADGVGAEPKHWGDPRFDRPELPVVGVSWREAQEYCRWAGLSLPSEAQWEAAARGEDRRRFPWGDEPPSSETCCYGSRIEGPVAADRYPGGTGPFGTLAQAGSVWEWCLDTWQARAYLGRHLSRDPVLREEGLLKVVRGGSWMSSAVELLATHRLPVPLGARFNSQGFRCVWTPES